MYNPNDGFWSQHCDYPLFSKHNVHELVRDHIAQVRSFSDLTLSVKCNFLYILDSDVLHRKRAISSTCNSKLLLKLESRQGYFDMIREVFSMRVPQCCDHWGSLTQICANIACYLNSRGFHLDSVKAFLLPGIRELGTSTISYGFSSVKS